jgi:hypothetical protein
MLESETPDDEKDRKHDETHKLNWFAANGINEGDCDPVTRNRSCDNKDGVTGSQVVQLVVDSWSTSITNSGKHSGRVQSKTVKGNIQEEPRSSSTKENLSVGPLSVESSEVSETGLGGNKSLLVLESLSLCNGINISTGLSCNVGIGI